MTTPLNLMYSILKSMITQLYLQLWTPHYHQLQIHKYVYSHDEYNDIDVLFFKCSHHHLWSSTPQQIMVKSLSSHMNTLPYWGRYVSDISKASERSIFPPQACSGVSSHETPYYCPASKEEELYSQLRQENIKAIPKDEIEWVSIVNFTIVL